MAPHSTFFVWLMAAVLTLAHASYEALDVSVIAVLPNAKSPVALPYLGAPIELAVEDVNRNFKNHLNLTLHFLSLMDLPRGCADAQQEEMRLVAEFYYKRPRSKCSVIIGTSKDFD
jgi:hypothetical protein